LFSVASFSQNGETCGKKAGCTQGHLRTGYNVASEGGKSDCSINVNVLHIIST
jgi:hypothetical protein